MAEVTGDAVAIRIFSPGLQGGSAIFVAAHASWDDRAKLQPLNTSPNEAYSADIPVSETLTATIVNATYDPKDNIFQAPLNIRSGSRIGLKIYPAGLDEDPIACSYFLIEASSGDHDANSPEGLAPITFRGRSQGYYQMPGDSIDPAS
jgi:hypothetical protein